MTLRVTEIFESLQGEGYWTGVPMTFVRLAGCNAAELGLECVRWCDTRGSQDRTAGEVMEVADIVSRLRLPRMCLTGGEPLLQLDSLLDLLTDTRRRGIRVHLETNGTIAPPGAQGREWSGLKHDQAGDLFDWVTVSPKPPNYVVAPGWEGRIDELKLICDEDLDVATAELLAAAHPSAVVCLQPEEGGDRRSLERAIRMVMSHPDWRLSLQLHKILSIR